MITTTLCTLRFMVPGLFALGLLLPSAALQEEEEEPGGWIDPEHILTPPPQNEAADEMMALFRMVERRLAEIDALLYDAGAGKRGLGALEESGIGDLLQASRQRGEKNLEDIDRILEIAAEQGGT